MQILKLKEKFQVARAQIGELQGALESQNPGCQEERADTDESKQPVDTPHSPDPETDAVDSPDVEVNTSSGANSNDPSNSSERQPEVTNPDNASHTEHKDGSTEELEPGPLVIEGSAEATQDNQGQDLEPKPDLETPVRAESSMQMICVIVELFRTPSTSPDMAIE